MAVAASASSVLLAEPLEDWDVLRWARRSKGNLCRYSRLPLVAWSTQVANQVHINLNSTNLGLETHHPPQPIPGGLASPWGLSGSRDEDQDMLGLASEGCSTKPMETNIGRVSLSPGHPAQSHCPSHPTCPQLPRATGILPLPQHLHSTPAVLPDVSVPAVVPSTAAGATAGSTGTLDRARQNLHLPRWGRGAGRVAAPPEHNKHKYYKHYFRLLLLFHTCHQPQLPQDFFCPSVLLFRDMPRFAPSLFPLCWGLHLFFIWSLQKSSHLSHVLVIYWICASYILLAFISGMGSACRRAMMRY